MALIELSEEEIAVIWLALVHASNEITDTLDDEAYDALVSKFEVKEED